MSQKKSFKSDLNPAMQFISVPQETSDKPQKITESQKAKPIYPETRSKRLQLLLTPSLHDNLKKIAQSENRSLNDLINSILESYLNKPH